MATLEFFCNRLSIVALMELSTYLSPPPLPSSPAGTTSAAPMPPTANLPAPALPAAASAADIGSPGMEGRSNRGGDEGRKGEGVEEKGEREGQMGREAVKGLLGRGKARVVFGLHMAMQHARVFLNLEDGRQLAMLEQERLSVQVKVFPASTRVNASLGNLRLCNLQLPPSHPWRWFCDLRDKQSASLVEIEYNSYNPDDDDYEGFEYSIDGKLSAVRLIFLYRFVQEFMAYFWGLAAPGVRQEMVVRVVDAVGGIERRIQQWEVAGSSGIRYNVSLDAPILILPRTTDSQEFMQLGLGHMGIRSSVEWRGGKSIEDAGAVRCDVITVESRDVSLLVGAEGVAGAAMIERMAGLTLTIQRQLRDLFKKLPTYQFHIHMGELRVVMSHREYLIICDCLFANLAEPPQPPPYFRLPPPSTSSSTQPSHPTPSAQVTSPTSLSSPRSPTPPSSPPPTTVVAGGQTGEGKGAQGAQGEGGQGRAGEVAKAGGAGGAGAAFTYFRVLVDVQHVQMELFTGHTRDSSLALLQVRALPRPAAGPCTASPCCRSVHCLALLQVRALPRPAAGPCTASPCCRSVHCLALLQVRALPRPAAGPCTASPCCRSVHCLALLQVRALPRPAAGPCTASPCCRSVHCLALLQVRALPRPAAGPCTASPCCRSVHCLALLQVRRSRALPQIEGLWVEYRTTSAREMEVMLSLPTMAIIDRRAATRQELRLMMGSALHAHSHAPPAPPGHGEVPAGVKAGGAADEGRGRQMGGGSPPVALSMVVLNYSTRPAARAVVLRFQRPRVLVALDFLLAVTHFFFPSLAASSGNDTDRDERDDPASLAHAVVLTSGTTRQAKAVVTVSPQRQLIAEAAGVDEYEYDGCGGVLRLLPSDAQGGTAVPAGKQQGEGVAGGPVIVVGNGKHLRLKNITVESAWAWEQSVYLGCDSSFTADPEDGVIWRHTPLAPGPNAAGGAGSRESSGAEAGGAGVGGEAEVPPEQTSFSFDLQVRGLYLQAVGPELTFYDSTKWPAGIPFRPERILRASFDVSLLYAAKGADTWVKGTVRGLLVETAAGLAVVEPVDAHCERECVAGKTSLELACTDVSLRLPFHSLRLLHRLHADTAAALKLGGGPVAAQTHRREGKEGRASSPSRCGGPVRLQAMPSWATAPRWGEPIIADLSFPQLLIIWGTHHCVLPSSALRVALICTACCPHLHCVLPSSALRVALICTACCPHLHCVLPSSALRVALICTACCCPPSAPCLHAALPSSFLLHLRTSSLVFPPHPPPPTCVGATHGRAAPPEHAVLAVSTAFRRVKRPLGFSLLWCSHAPAAAPAQEAADVAAGGEGGDDTHCRIWLPLAPPGYAALGCVAAVGRAPPHVSTVHCVRCDLLTPSSLSDCIFYRPGARSPTSDASGTERGGNTGGGASMWVVGNSMRTFFACQGTAPPPPAVLRDLREDLRFHPATTAPDPDDTDPEASSHSPTSTSLTCVPSGRLESLARLPSSRFQPPLAASASALAGAAGAAARPFVPAASFERVWWSKGAAGVTSHVSFWRPVAVPGYAMLGDCVADGFDPPDAGLLLLDDLDSGRVAAPLSFLHKLTLAAPAWPEEASVWFPLAPPGYVALGCVVTRGREPPSAGLGVRCVRADLLAPKGFAGRPAWTVGVPPKGESIASFWPVINQVGRWEWGGGSGAVRWEWGGESGGGACCMFN
ncbi:unnamed protein product [Closterium sp. NIES-65]|nr:unnamed protein product [Closterium sp. NIES-65]